MSKNERRMQLHDAMTWVGWIAGREAHALAYWIMRLADEIEDVGKYRVAYRSLREMAWDNVRPFSTSENAIDVRLPSLVRQFLTRHEHQFSSRYAQCLREIRSSLDALASVPAYTGRTPLPLAA